MEVENGELGLNFWRGKKNSLEMFAIAVDEGEVFSHYEGVVDRSFSRPIRIRFRFDLSRPNYIFPGFFKNIHTYYLCLTIIDKIILEFGHILYQQSSKWLTLWYFF